jgi:hypothetical protein
MPPQHRLAKHKRANRNFANQTSTSLVPQSLATCPRRYITSRSRFMERIITDVAYLLRSRNFYCASARRLYEGNAPPNSAADAPIPPIAPCSDVADLGSQRLRVPDGARRPHHVTNPPTSFGSSRELFVRTHGECLDESTNMRV